MSALADRLRGVLGRAEGRPLHGDLNVPAPSDVGADLPLDLSRGRQVGPGDDAVAETLEGDWHGEGTARYLVVDRKYGPGHRHGRVAVADAMPPDSGVWPRVNLLSPRSAPALAGAAGRLLFVDLETTGLAGGAGTYAFLVGCAWFDGATFRTRQFFLSSFGAEAALLRGVAALAEDAAGLVTYNGKSFDVPLLETRFVMNRMAVSMAELPHVDMLHPARRLWKEIEAEAETDRASIAGGCRLTSLERTQCGFSREGDVPGFEIPARYFRFVRSGDARPLASVLEHNRLDLISLALLTGRACQLLDDGADGAGNAREALGLGRIFEAAGLMGEAVTCFARAAGIGRGPDPGAAALRGDTVTRAEALRAYAVACRRARLYADAADAWTRLVGLRGCPAAIMREATEALAIHHEHRLRDVAHAREYALRSLRCESTRSRQEALHYRLARLERKLAAADGPRETPLFSA